jgi:hypothetical protein
MGKNLHQLLNKYRVNIQTIKGLKKLISKRIKNSMNNWANKLHREFSEKKKTHKWLIIPERMFNILSHKGNPNQNYTKSFRRQDQEVLPCYGPEISLSS